MTENEFTSSFFELHQHPNAVVLVMKRLRLTDDDNLQELDQELMQVLETTPGRTLVCDLGSVNYVTSSAIGKLIALHRKSSRTNSRLVLCSLQPTVETSLKASQLHKYFNIYSDQAAALASV